MPTTKRYYVANDNYNSDLNTYIDTNFPDRVIYKQISSNLDSNVILFKENNLPIFDYFPDAPSIGYPAGYVGDTIHPSVDGWADKPKFIVTMTSTIDPDRHPKFYVAHSLNQLDDILSRLFPNVSKIGSVNEVRARLLSELQGPGNGYLTYNNFLHPGCPFPLTQSDLLYPTPVLVIDPFFFDCFDGSSNAFYDISYTTNDYFSSPNGLPSISYDQGAFTDLDTHPLIKNDYFNTVAAITTTGNTMGIEFWVRSADNTSGVAIPAFIRGWSGTISCGVTINDGQVGAYLNGSLSNISTPNSLNPSAWNHIFVSYEPYNGGIGVKCYVNGADVTLGGIPIAGSAVVGTHQETTSIGCYTDNGTSRDSLKPIFGSNHQIAMIRFYWDNNGSLDVPYLYQASRDRFI